ncbi:MAG: hypothetical protein LUO95_12510, partial [Methylococcaceae bacterium]|nr:hypothetical protein [Methylococcaceae bacterium]
MTVYTGTTGNDTYLFAKGAGTDTIYDYDSISGNTDTVQFSDVLSTEISALTRTGYDLVLQYGATDKLTISYYFLGISYQVEQFKFSDAVTWNDAYIKAHVITNGTAASDFIIGDNDGTNRIFGLDGNDYLSGGALADQIDGGLGDDTLYGNAG